MRGRMSLAGNLTNAVSVAAGWYHGLAVKLDHRVDAWGDNSAGQATVPA